MPVGMTGSSLEELSEDDSLEDDSDDEDSLLCSLELSLSWLVDPLWLDSSLEEGEEDETALSHPDNPIAATMTADIKLERFGILDFLSTREAFSPQIIVFLIYIT